MPDPNLIGFTGDDRRLGWTIRAAASYDPTGRGPSTAYGDLCYAVGALPAILTTGDGAERALALDNVRRLAARVLDA